MVLFEMTAMSFPDVSLPTAAKLIGCSYPAIRAWVEDGLVPVTGRVHKRVASDVIENIRGKPVSPDELLAALPPHRHRHA